MRLPNIALSIKQPWAWLIAAGHKDIENRTWRTRFRGQFCIHAPKAFDMDGYRWVAYHFPEIEMPHPDAFKLGGIIGVANLIGCVRSHSSIWFNGPWGFILRDPVQVEFIPMPGKLGFFPVSELQGVMR